jgi:hypothetical protein
MPETKIITVPRPHNFFYYGFGLAILVLNKIRHSIQGYKSPRTFPMSEIKKAIEYDVSVVNHWISVLEEYTRTKSDLTGKTVLELGPGADLGVGLILLARGAAKYNAIDVNNLVESVPTQFYDEMYRYLSAHEVEGPDKLDGLRAQLNLTQAGKNDRLNYVCRKDFDVSVFANEAIDVVFSQAAFEHFDDIDTTFFRLSKATRSGTILVAEIDLNTHTRWIRDVDPLNIYRFSDFFYDLLRFPGSPNRHRPIEYKQTLEKHGWEDVEIWPLTRVDDNYVSRVKRALPSKFQQDSSQIEYLSAMICARKR